MKIIIATRNLNKIKEITSIISIPDVEFMSMNNFPQIPEIHETGTNFTENALIKAKTVNKYTGYITMSDDSGLEIEALGNKPGINSSRFLGEKTDYNFKNNKILELLKSVPYNERKARFVCSIAICFNSEDYKVVSGICEGYISSDIRGEQGFGYDPIFLVPAYKKTYAELNENIKNNISHRALALQKAKDIILERCGNQFKTKSF
ncbi:MAG: RdgB/HAM1 family non-canonical purine NTP pyrophosphatase [Candidatus Firestonebacteria bacterium]|nr:RdgB/HAM1 family non-canonical purine NTP pyrophosphatase [Candidatus Firestonebacteria bacterium]